MPRIRQGQSEPHGLRPKRTRAIAFLSPGTQEQLSAQDRRTETLGLRLRTDEGLPADWLRPQDEGFVSMLLREGLAQLLRVAD